MRPKSCGAVLRDGNLPNSTVRPRPRLLCPRRRIRPPYCRNIPLPRPIRYWPFFLPWAMRLRGMLRATSQYHDLAPHVAFMPFLIAEFLSAWARQML